VLRSDTTEQAMKRGNKKLKLRKLKNKYLGI
jgi:hypothetical protein